MLRILRPLDQLRNSISSLLSLWTNTADRVDVVQDTTQLVRCRRVRSHLQLELAALLLCVRLVVGCLVFCCRFAGHGGGLFEDVQGPG